MAMAKAETPCPDRMVQVARAEIPVANHAPGAAAIFAAPAFDLRASIPVVTDRLIE
jgi:hypothetical protein